MVDKYMGVAEVKRHFSDVVGEVLHKRSRIVIKRRGRPVVAIVPLEEEETRTPGQRLSDVMGFGGKEGEEFHQLMKQIVKQRRRRMPRTAPEIKI